MCAKNTSIKEGNKSSISSFKLVSYTWGTGGGGGGGGGGSGDNGWVAVVRVISHSFPSPFYEVDAVLSVSSIFPLDEVSSVRDDVSSRTQHLSRISLFV